MIATKLLEQLSGRRPASVLAGLSTLTDRELEILQLLGEAKTSCEIAGQLHLSSKTVDTRRLNLVRKLKIKSPAELMRSAVSVPSNMDLALGRHFPTALACESQNALASLSRVPKSFSSAA